IPTSVREGAGLRPGAGMGRPPAMPRAWESTDEIIHLNDKSRIWIAGVDGRFDDALPIPCGAARQLVGSIRPPELGRTMKYTIPRNGPGLIARLAAATAWPRVSRRMSTQRSEGSPAQPMGTESAQGSRPRPLPFMSRRWGQEAWAGGAAGSSLAVGVSAIRAMITGGGGVTRGHPPGGRRANPRWDAEAPGDKPMFHRRLLVVPPPPSPLRVGPP